MSNVYTSMEQLIGNTPLLELCAIEKKYALSCKLLAKLEYFNPAGSVKDRAAKKMLDDAVKSGEIKEDTIIVEPTSGNTGIGLAAVGAARGYKTVIIMPDTMSKERIALMKGYGAEVLLTDGKKGMQGAIDKASEMKKENPNVFIPSQFENPSNPQAHFETTGVEIYQDTDKQVDIFVAGIGTGGTVTGVGKYLKSQNPAVQVVGVEPFSSSVLSGGQAGAHKIQGIGAGFIPKALDLSVCDEIIPVQDENAFEKAKEVGKTEGVLVGISSGAALYAAIEVAKRKENENKTVVVLFPDGGDRYLSTALFED